MPKDNKGRLKPQVNTIRPVASSDVSANNLPTQGSSLYDPEGPKVLKRWNDTDYNELNPITWLNTIHQKLRTPAPPKYNYTQEVLANGFYCTVEFLEQRFKSPEPRLKKQEAKEDAAKIALLTLEQQMPIIFKQIKDALVKASTVPKKDTRICRGGGLRQLPKIIQPTDTIPHSVEWLDKFKATHVNERPCVMLLEFCQYHKLGQPVYNLRQDWEGHLKMDCEVNSRKFSSEHTFKVKKDAKDHVSQIAFDILYNEFISKEQAEIDRKVRTYNMRQGLYREEPKKIHEEIVQPPTPFANYSVSGGYYDNYTNYYTPTLSENIQAVTNFTYDQPLGYQDPNGNTNNNLLGNAISYNSQPTVDSYGYASSSTVPFFNNVDNKSADSYAFPTPNVSQFGHLSTNASFINVANSPTSLIQTSASNGYHPYAVPVSHNKHATTKKLNGRARKERRLLYGTAAPLHKPTRALEKEVSDRNGRLLRKKYITLLHELCQRRSWSKPDFDFHNICGGYRSTVTINCRIFTGSKLCPKKSDAKEEVAELAYKFYETDQ
ncbi:18272_t:CDS:1 [Funneliformis geosporum]|uniref:13798_t:CDS:1 n=1 Tax=Funneliformis geosporum TaxID=1117311 RepID=A0A9W4X639_9GLOM|nr:18272_t:CDS:1 [Funneliformis geosporum]CAI2189282.1 13798_t:CDS:1 [Funneliformis geosporum]